MIQKYRYIMTVSIHLYHQEFHLFFKPHGLHSCRFSSIPGTPFIFKLVNSPSYLKLTLLKPWLSSNAVILCTLSIFNFNFYIIETIILCESLHLLAVSTSNGDIPSIVNLNQLCNNSRCIIFSIVTF